MLLGLISLALSGNEFLLQFADRRQTTNHRAYLTLESVALLEPHAGSRGGACLGLSPGPSPQTDRKVRYACAEGTVWSWLCASWNTSNARSSS
jgi:hypothetical protein